MSTPLGCDEKSSRVNGDMVNVTDSAGKTWKVSNQNLFANLPISENPFDIDDLAEITSLEDDDYFALLDDTDGQHKKISKDNLESEIGGGSGGGSISYAKLSDHKTTSNNGGTFTSGANRTRDLNTIDFDPDSIVSLNSNQFTLQAGTYGIKAYCPACATNQHRGYIYNVSDATIEAKGLNEYTHSAGYNSSTSVVSCFLTLTSSKVFEIQHRCTTTRTDWGFGVACGYGDDEIYTVVEIKKYN